MQVKDEVYVICYQIKTFDNNLFSPKKESSSYLFSVSKDNYAIHFTTGDTALSLPNFKQYLLRREFTYFDLANNLKFSFNPVSDQWKIEKPNQYNVHEYVAKSDSVLGYPIDSGRLITYLSDTISFGSSPKVPASASILFGDQKGAILKLKTGDFEIFPVWIKKAIVDLEFIREKLPTIYQIIPSENSYSFYEANNGVTVGKKIAGFKVEKDGKERTYAFDENKYSIVVFAEQIDYLQDSLLNEKLIYQLRKYLAELTHNIELIKTFVQNKKNVTFYFITSETKAVIENSYDYNFLHTIPYENLFTSAGRLLHFYKIDSTPEVFLVNPKGELIDRYSSHFFEAMSIEEFLENLKSKIEGH